MNKYQKGWKDKPLNEIPKMVCYEMVKKENTLRSRFKRKLIKIITL